MYEVLVIENSPNYNGAPLACWTEVFETFSEAWAYRTKTIIQEPLSYNRDCVTTLITNLEVTGRADLLEVQP